MSKEDDMKAIVANMRRHHSGKWVNCAVAIGSLEPRAFMLIDELVKHKIIERKYINGLPLVRYTDTSWLVPKLKTIDGDKNE